MDNHNFCSILLFFSLVLLFFCQIHKEMLEIDYDRSGTIEFKEFVTLMKKVNRKKLD